MVKRKASAPQKSDEAKRQLQTWTMGVSSLGGLLDDSVEDVATYPQSSSKLCKSASKPVCRVTVHKDVPACQWTCRLGQISFQLDPLTTSKFFSTLEKHDLFSMDVNKVPDALCFKVPVASASVASSSQRKRGVPALSDGDAVSCSATVVDDIPSNWLMGLRHRAFYLSCQGLSSATGSTRLVITVSLTEAGVLVPHFPSVYHRPKEHELCVKNWISYFYGLCQPDSPSVPSTGQGQLDLEELFDLVQSQHVEGLAVSEPVVQHPLLIPVLRNYQAQAVRWMIGREQEVPTQPERLHPLYKQLTTADGQIVFYNVFTGHVVREKPLTVAPIKGGVLADEMGLGKTVEMLACILLHRRHQDQVLLNAVSENRNCMTDRSIKLNLKEGGVHLNPMGQDECAAVQNTHEIDRQQYDPGYTATTQVQCTDSLAHVELKGDFVNEVTVQTDVQNGKVKSKKKPARKGKKSAVRQFLQQSYEIALASLPKPHTSQSTEDYWSVQTRRGSFECICGKTEAVNGHKHVQCRLCHVWQHASCVKYDHHQSTVSENAHRSTASENDLQNTVSDSDFHQNTVSINNRLNTVDKNSLHSNNVNSSPTSHTDYKDFLCPHCLLLQPPIASGATLIVAPSTICHQWVEEVEKHLGAGTLRVLVYKGVHHEGFTQPQTLASNYDIVVTTYEVLRRELNYVDLPHSNSEQGRRLRAPKRYMAIPSPLPAVEWWRVCLDEAQMVEGTMTRTAEMCLKLAAVNRWCITGTPIQRSLDDLYGLLLFLGADPWWVKNWYSELLVKPYESGNKEPLLKSIGHIMWRTAKKNVLEEMGLSAQKEIIHWLKFSSVEEHFYKRQFSKCASEALQRVHKCDLPEDTMICTLNRDVVHHLLYPLTNLRQACCHPQAVRGEFLPLHKGALTMEELLKQLIHKVKFECEESQRQIVLASNGIAAIHIIRGELAEAVECYRDILRTSEERDEKQKVRTDPLLKLHTIHNLQEILSTAPKGVGSTLRDEILSSQCEEIRLKYMKKPADATEASWEAWREAKQNIQELQADLNGCVNWWYLLITHYQRVHYDSELIMKIQEDFGNNQNPNCLVKRFSSCVGLIYVLTQALDHLQSTREKIIKQLNNLNAVPECPAAVEQVVLCCLRPVKHVLNTCTFCQTHDLFESYEAALFDLSEKDQEEIEALEGSWMAPRSRRRLGDGDTGKLLRSIVGYQRQAGGDHALTTYGNTHIKILDMLKTEFIALRKVWTLQKEQVAALDELNMGTCRLRVRLEGEPKADPPVPNILEQHEVQDQLIKCRSDKIIGETELKKRYGHLLYLQNLTHAQTPFENGINPDPCPVCRNELGTRWIVLLCGHSFCMECLRALVCVSPVSTSFLRCPVCRQRSWEKDVACVTTEKVDQGSVMVKGDHSTKIQGIVKCLMDIHCSDSTAKILVFSTWQLVLEVISKALDDNHIQYISLLANNKFQANLDSFKHSPNTHILLMPLHSGANGLNLVEATHVLLVEPILNPAQEQQAIGRIHRIGQTKLTWVHRFIVSGTIEERMHNMALDHAPAAHGLDVEQAPFTIGEFKNLFCDMEPCFS